MSWLLLLTVFIDEFVFIVNWLNHGMNNWLIAAKFITLVLSKTTNILLRFFRQRNCLQTNVCSIFGIKRTSACTNSSRFSSLFRLYTWVLVCVDIFITKPLTVEFGRGEAMEVNRVTVHREEWSVTQIFHQVKIVGHFHVQRLPIGFWKGNE